MNILAQMERWPVRKLYEDLKQPEGYRDSISVIETPDGDGIIISVGGCVVTMPIRDWLELAWSGKERWAEELALKFEDDSDEGWRFSGRSHTHGGDVADWIRREYLYSPCGCLKHKCMGHNSTLNNPT